MIEEIQRSGAGIDSAIERAKKKDPRFRLMGFGHRVYKTYDPRARIAKRTCMQLLEKLGMGNDPILHLAVELEEKGARRLVFPRAATSTRTSISTPASPTVRWASRPTCSRCSSRSAGCPAGSPTGSNRRTRPRRRSGAPARSTPARPPPLRADGKASVAGEKRVQGSGFRVQAQPPAKSSKAWKNPVAKVPRVGRFARRRVPLQFGIQHSESRIEHPASFLPEPEP